MANSMRINLLKNRRVLSEKDYLREKKFLQLSVIGLGVVLAVSLAMAIWNYGLASRLAKIEASIASANKQMQGLANANAEQVYVKNRLSLIGKFLDEQAIARESLQQVLSLSLPGVVIGAIKFEGTGEVGVTVSADTTEALKLALEYYRDNEGYFPQVVSQGVTRGSEGGYEMKLRLTLPSATLEKS